MLLQQLLVLLLLLLPLLLPLLLLLLLPLLPVLLLLLLLLRLLLHLTLLLLLLPLHVLLCCDSCETTQTAMSLTSLAEQEPPKWRSHTRGRVTRWSCGDVQVLADMWLQGLPKLAVAMIEDGKCVGGTLIDIPRGRRPGRSEVRRAYLWLKPVVILSKNMPGNSCLSGFYIADALIELHMRLKEQLFTAGKSGSQALRESRKLKRLWGALRHLYRCNKGSPDPLIKELKGYMVGIKPSGHQDDAVHDHDDTKGCSGSHSSSSSSSSSSRRINSNNSNKCCCVCFCRWSNSP